MTWLPQGPLSGLTFGNGQVLTKAYNLRYEPKSITSGPVTLGYTMSLSGDVAGLTTSAGEETYGYDFQDRLVRRKASNGVRAEPLEVGYVGGRMASATTGGKSRLAFGYDEQGNVSAVSAYDASGTAIEKTVCLVHDALGRLVAAGHAAPGTGGADALVCRSEAELAEVIARFRYDAWNRRVARQEGSGAWTVWAYDGEGRPLSEVAPSGTSWTAGRDYVFLEGQPLAQVEYPGPAGGEGYRYYFHTDHLGLPRAMTSGSGQVAWSAAAIPNGELQETVAPDAASGRTVVTNLRLPGQYDERLFAAAGISGLAGPYYNWNRWYLPSLGRYLELDPIAKAGGFNGFYGPNWYGYAEGNPLSWSDPTGLTTYKCTKPLDALTKKFGKSAGEFAHDWVPALYHQYTCILRKDGTLRCEGQDHSGSAWRSPGKKSEDTWDKGTCNLRRKPDDCYEKCLEREWDKPRPTYGIPFGTDCQEYDDEVNNKCALECGKAP